MPLRFIHVVVFEYIVPFYCCSPLYTIVSLSIHSLKDIWMVSNFGWLWVELLRTCTCRLLCKHEFSFLWVNALESDCWAVWSVYKKRQRYFPEWLCHFMFLSVMCEFQFHMLVSTWYCHCIYFGHPNKAIVNSSFNGLANG